MTSRVRVLVADDSVTARELVVSALREDPHIEVVAQAADGVEAVEMAKTLSPDVITMDVEMPRMNGLEAIATIMAEAPSRILVVCSVTRDSQVNLSFRAMEAGALELISKPDGAPGAELGTWRRKLAEAVRLMAEIPVVTRRRRHPPLVDPRARASRAVVLGIVASTGGPPALAQILGALPAAFPVPVLVAQHMAAGFTPGLVRWLAEASPLKFEIAFDESAAVAGHVYLPPDGCDLQVDDRGLLRLSKSQATASPSGNQLLLSLARTYRERAGGLVLTGMGEDGAEGLLAIRRAGGLTLAQDEITSVVFGMPQAARRLGAVETLLPLEAIGPTLRGLLCG
jgi:two-component system, chemotaxis family, protein-glutamate methylesterase/glutaminase